MSAYTAPLKDMKFVLNELAGMAEVAKLPGCEDATPDTVDAILEEAAKFTTEVLDPLNWTGDQEGSQWKDGAVKTPKGFKEIAGYTSLSYKPTVRYTGGEWVGEESGVKFVSAKRGKLTILLSKDEVRVSGSGNMEQVELALQSDLIRIEPRFAGHRQQQRG